MRHVILAGGLSERFGGSTKALLPVGDGAHSMLGRVARGLPPGTIVVAPEWVLRLARLPEQTVPCALTHQTDHPVETAMFAAKVLSSSEEVTFHDCDGFYPWGFAPTTGRGFAVSVAHVEDRQSYCSVLGDGSLSEKTENGPGLVVTGSYTLPSVSFLKGQAMSDCYKGRTPDHVMTTGWIDLGTYQKYKEYHASSR